MPEASDKVLENFTCAGIPCAWAEIRGWFLPPGRRFAMEHGGPPATIRSTQKEVPARPAGGRAGFFWYLTEQVSCTLPHISTSDRA
jgi:hypothetical protein